MYLNIGPICYCLNVADGLQFGPPDSPYRGFWSPKPGSDSKGQIPVEVVLQDTCLPSDFSLLFDTNDAWQAHAKGTQRVITHWPERGRPPVWAAFFDIAQINRGIRICCDPQWFALADGWRNPLSYPLDHVLSMYVLAGCGMIMHGCGVVADGSVTVFAGVSGSGKSTIARRMLRELPVTVLSDDRIIITASDGGLSAYGSPWLGEADLAENVSASLGAVCFLNKGEQLAKERLSFNQAARRLLPVLAVPWYEPDISRKIMATIDRLLKIVPVYAVTVPAAGPVAALLQ